MKISVSNVIEIENFEEHDFLIPYIKKHLTIPNNEYFIRKKMGKSLWGYKSVQTFFRLTDNKIVVPRGFLPELTRYLSKNSISFLTSDKRHVPNKIIFPSDIILLKHQNKALESAMKNDCGIIVAPPGSGKTVIALKIIKQKSFPALVLVHRRQLHDQWSDRIQSFLKIPKKDIGFITSKKMRIGERITLTTLQTLSKIKPNDIKNIFGTVFVDECHHIPAKTFRKAVVKLNPLYIYGLTATPVRKNKDEKAIFIFIGDIIHDMSKDSESSLRENVNSKGEIYIKIISTCFSVPFDLKTGDINLLNKTLIFDTTRNRTILERMNQELEDGKKVILITERKEHIEALNMFISSKYDCVNITGDDSARSRTYKTEKIKSGDYQIIMTTGQFFGEGADVLSLDCLFLAFPLAFDGKLFQYIGRILRGDDNKTIYDFRDSGVEYYENQFRKRERFYRKIENLLKRPVRIESERAKQ
ncbi:DEAD/DEAH box helicase [candidate division WOR-3 bacterium]|nr:DEAD/DEAH box helicase [candidate division WOR-3 bacterium]